LRLFGRRRPLHRQLADEAGLSLGPGDAPAPTGPSAAPPGWDGEQRGEPGIHGVPRVRRWDAVAVADSPELVGNAVHFVALPDGTVVVDEDEPDGAVAPLADAVEARLAPPYRAEAVRRGGSSWAVAARRIAVVAESSLDGDEAELVVSRDGRSLTVDGSQRVPRAPALEAAGAAEATEFVVRARRLDGDLWEAEVAPL
jgi:hypothetical protein